MSVHDLCCIGYITQDKIVTTKNTIYMPGGTSFYFAHAIKHLDPNIIRKTKCFDFWERNVLFPKTKRSFFRTPTLPFSA